MAQAGVQADHQLVERLRGGDESAFAELVDSCHGTMLAVAQAHVGSRTVAADVVQEAWMRAIRELDDVSDRLPLKTWTVRLVVDTVKARRLLSSASLGAAEAAVDPERFRGPGDRYPGGWRVFPADWRELPDDTLHDDEAAAVIAAAIAALPPAQRAVIRMRDLEGYTAGEVSDALGVGEEVERLLLHRGRSRVRAALEQHLP